jgi:ATP-dependent DNA helicase RecQ
MALIRQVLQMVILQRYWNVWYFKSFAKGLELLKPASFLMSEDHEYNETEDEVVTAAANLLNCRRSLWYDVARFV